jgi:hypothetical protein
VKYHRKVERYVYGDKDPERLEDFLARLRDISFDLVDPRVDARNGWELCISGWLPMTEAQRHAADRAAERAKVAAAQRKAKKEARELAEYERLRAKFAQREAS